jgi:hypothetical protein
MSRISYPVASESNQLNTATPLLLHTTGTDNIQEETPILTPATNTSEDSPHGLDESQTCAECASPIGDFCTCTICNRMVHPGCLHGESSGAICRTSAATLHSDSDTQGGELGGYFTASPIGSPALQPSPSTDDDSFATKGPTDTTPKRLSPQGRLTKPTCITRLAANSSKQPPNYSQSTLSFASKQASSTSITGATNETNKHDT